jgi:hypothetical protein
MADRMTASSAAIAMSISPSEPHYHNISFCAHGSRPSPYDQGNRFDVSQGLVAIYKT